MTTEYQYEPGVHEARERGKEHVPNTEEWHSYIDHLRSQTFQSKKEFDKYYLGEWPNA